jgi:hypothetical protein
MNETDPNLLTVEQALERVLAACIPVAGSETWASPTPWTGSSPNR